ncbi:MAG: glycosyltransferase family 2 protein [Parcubacteria group bacterium]|nr:glycosyltransferase family 2 protein [Parcubacteria group bacterium]
MNPLVSIIIRAKNEGAWIGKTLEALSKQTYKSFEVIVVDNLSTDNTVKIVEQYGHTVVPFTGEYRPGLAINEGIRASRGSMIAVLSAHAVPVNEHWLSRMVDALLEHADHAGVYGRQLPTEESSPFDKRDLVITFGPERRLQRVDSFFHNANSLLHRHLWERHPFDESVTNIEDRLWAKTVQAQGGVIVYEPRAQVYHHHGIHQHGNVKRAETTVKVLDALEKSGEVVAVDNPQVSQLILSDVLTIVPISPDTARRMLRCPAGGKRTFLDDCFVELTSSVHVGDVVVASDHSEVIMRAQEVGFRTFFYSTDDFDGPSASLSQVLARSLKEVEDTSSNTSRYVLYLSPTHVFRPKGLLDRLIEKIVEEDVDSVFAAKRDYRACWAATGDSFVRLDEGFVKRTAKHPLWMGYTGLGCVTITDLIRQGKRVGDSVALVPVEDPIALLDLREEQDFETARRIYSVYKHV